MLTMHKMHHPKADIDGLNVKRTEGGRGLVQVEAAYKAEIINIAEYLKTNYKEDQFLNIVRNHESTQPYMNSVLKLATKIIEELSQHHVKSDGTQHTKARLREVLKAKRKNKVMHGQYIRNIDRQLISEEENVPLAIEGRPKSRN